MKVEITSNIRAQERVTIEIDEARLEGLDAEKRYDAIQSQVYEHIAENMLDFGWEEVGAE